MQHLNGGCVMALLLFVIAGFFVVGAINWAWEIEV